MEFTSKIKIKEEKVDEDRVLKRGVRGVQYGLDSMMKFK
jgi:hypothetical protein